MGFKIFGIGVDIVKHSRIKKIIESKFQTRFLHKVLHSKELKEFNDKQDLDSKTSFLASRWGVKEAVVKASGRKDLIFPDIFLIKNEQGKPTLEFENQNKIVIYEQLLIKRTHVSLSHEEDASVAFVVLED